MREELFNIFNEILVCCVSTLQGAQIKNRMMHYGFDDDFNIYLASLKDDPKIKQIIINNQISLLIYRKGEQFPEDKEAEITGNVFVINEETEKKKAIEILKNRSPVVKNLTEAGLTNMLKFIKVRPQQIKFRYVKEILQGIPPKVVNFKEKKSSIIMEDIVKLKKKIYAWLTASRYPFLTVSILPAILGVAIAWTHERTFNFLNFFLTILGVIFLHLGTNIINDYFDYISNNDNVNNNFIRPFSGGSRVIQLGLLSSMEVLVGGLLFFISGSIIGLYFTLKFGITILILGMIGIISGFFYTTPKFNWLNIGIGEILVGLDFGVLITMGSYFIQVQHFSQEVILISIPIGLLISMILIINEIPDYEADKMTNKKTIIVRIGKQNSFILVGGLFTVTFTTMILASFHTNISKLYLILLMCLPIIYKIIKNVKFNYDNSLKMAPANGLTIIIFNIIAGITIISYLSQSISNFYLMLFILSLITWVLWNFIIIKKQYKTFLSLQRL